ncbi:MAG: peptidoglycan editing factor PgeF [Gammaproteobacteria bacterium]|nr:peptidoglycan editing factor PgeF [Gammaproteobacteria bacterium]MDX5374706.1 peptidoglycan editing factor PgeF [Gammaproteobacteria bacterium]
MTAIPDDPRWLQPTWPAPAGVCAVSTTRLGGVSRAPFDSFNLATHVGDDPQAVAANRRALRDALGLPAEPAWLEQVHGTTVVDAGHIAGTPAADASVAFGPGAVCVVQTADCLPVLFCSRRGDRVGAAHAGWRGLAGGVLEATVAALDEDPAELLAWLGPAIGPAVFEVGEEVRAAFLAQDAGAGDCFMSNARGRWQADIFALARRRLAGIGIGAVHGGGLCTVSDAARFYSYRRDRDTGRMASLIWISTAD